MSTGLRVALGAVAAAAALVVAASALAANTATISVSHTPMAPGGSQSTTIDVTVPPATDPIAAITIYVPTGYTMNLTAAAGTSIGSVDATAQGHDVGLTLPLTGPVTTDSPASHAADVCSPGTHGAVWNLNLSVAGSTLVVPLYVDPTSGAEQALGAYKMLICLPPWDVPVGTPGRAFQGAQLLEAAFTVNNVVTTPSSGGIAVWHSLFTPFVPTQGVPNPAGTFEARSLVALPVSLGLKAAKKGGGYALSGKLSEGGLPVAGAKVIVSRGSSTTRLATAGSATTAAGGSWSSSGKLASKKAATYFKATATVAARDATATGCQSPLPLTVAPGGCVSATLSPWTISSPVAKLKP